MGVLLAAGEFVRALPRENELDASSDKTHSTADALVELLNVLRGVLRRARASKTGSHAAAFRGRPLPGGCRRVSLPHALRGPFLRSTLEQHLRGSGFKTDRTKRACSPSLPVGRQRTLWIAIARGRPDAECLHPRAETAPPLSCPPCASG